MVKRKGRRGEDRHLTDPKSNSAKIYIQLLITTFSGVRASCTRATRSEIYISGSCCACFDRSSSIVASNTGRWLDVTNCSSEDPISVTQFVAAKFYLKSVK